MAFNLEDKCQQQLKIPIHQTRLLWFLDLFAFYNSGSCGSNALHYSFQYWVLERLEEIQHASVVHWQMKQGCILWPYQMIIWQVTKTNETNWKFSFSASSRPFFTSRYFYYYSFRSNTISGGNDGRTFGLGWKGTSWNGRFSFKRGLLQVNYVFETPGFWWGLLLASSKSNSFA